MDIGHLQFAVLGLAMIRPRFAANVNLPSEPDPDPTPPPKNALEVPPVPREDIRSTKPRPSVVWSNPDPMYSGKVLEPHQFAHKFCIWMVENGNTDWMLYWGVDSKIDRFCRDKNYRYPDKTTIRSILADMLRDNYKERQYVTSTKYRHLAPLTSATRVTVYRFTPGLVNFLTKEYNAMDRIADRIPTHSHVAPVTPRSKARKQGGKSVSQNKKSAIAQKKRTKTHKKTPTKSDHYLHGCPFSEAA